MFDLQVALILHWHFGLGKYVQNIFSGWRPWRPPRISNQNDYFSQVVPILPTKFRLNWPFGSGEEVQNRFSRWRPWRPYWILAILIYNWSQYFLSSFELNGLSVQEKQVKIAFLILMAALVAILDFDRNNFSYF